MHSFGDCPHAGKSIRWAFSEEESGQKSVVFGNSDKKLKARGAV